MDRGKPSLSTGFFPQSHPHAEPLKSKTQPSPFFSWGKWVQPGQFPPGLPRSGLKSNHRPSDADRSATRFPEKVQLSSGPHFCSLSFEARLIDGPQNLPSGACSPPPTLFSPFVVMLAERPMWLLDPGCHQPGLTMRWAHSPDPGGKPSIFPVNDNGLEVCLQAVDSLFWGKEK